MEGRADDLAEGAELPLPGTREPNEDEGAERAEATGGPGNVSVDEPTEPPLAAEGSDAVDEPGAGGER
jgi:hypothetical protein